MINQESKIKSLQVKGFLNEEISKILNIPSEQISKQKKGDINQESVELYSELQKDLAKLTLSELAKDQRDTPSILSAIKLQAELQEKKLALNKNYHDVEKVSKGYLYDRDNEIASLVSSGMSQEDIAKKFNLGVLGVKQALDRVSLNLPEQLKSLPPSYISETKTLDVDTRLKILQDAWKNKLTRAQVRDIVTKIKNEAR